MKTLTTIFFTLLCVSVWSQHVSEARYILDGKEVDSKLLDLIEVRNIDRMEVVKNTNPPEIRITTKKKIQYLDYKSLKRKAKVKQSENPPVVVDFQRIDDEKTMMIDKDLIKKIRFDNGVIELRTRWYKKRKKEQGKPKILIR
jgi:hypothetical protein